MSDPLCIDLYCGLGGWAEGFMAEGYRVVGFDIEWHDYGTGGYPGRLILQDVLTLHGSQLRNGAIIVASPPCTEPSYRAMPWKRAKALNAAGPPVKFIELFEACFRLQREASEAAGRYIPLVVENVKGAQPWVGRAKAHYGSFYLWGDIESVGGRIVASGPPRFGAPSVVASKAQKFNPDGTEHGQGSWFKIADSKNRGARKVPVYSDPRRNGGPGKHLTSPHENAEGVKQAGHSGRAWFADPDVAGRFSSKSNARKAASALIAKIPFPLAQHIARVYKPEECAT